MSLAARLRALPCDQSGATAVFTGILLIVALGFVGLGVDLGVGYTDKRAAQSAADSAAFSGAVGKMAGAGNVPDQAKAVAAQYGLSDGVGGVVVQVNTPPAAGALAGNAEAVEVIITRPGRRFFSSFFATGATTIQARAVAVSGRAGNGCVVALNPNAPAAVLENGTPDVDLVGCSLYDNSSSATSLYLNGSARLSADNIFLVGGYGTSNNATLTSTHGIQTNQKPIADPYRDVPVPPYSGCDYNSYNAPLSNTTFSTSDADPTVFCNGLTLNGVGTTYTFNPGVYIIDRGQFTVNGSIKVQGVGVTFVLTSSTGANYATTTINGSAEMNLRAPNSGPTAGFAFYQDRRAPSSGTNTLNGTSNSVYSGALYFPSQHVTFNGTNNTANGGCTQLLADTVTFNGTPTFEVNCSGSGTRSIGGYPTTLVE